ncbi:PQQ-like beta-propeller repeat protein, partial [Nocardia cyriacigeorgica]|nr:PQQ-like beta-propeller repeat protein [Nocardia cyriacigeorgica]
VYVGDNSNRLIAVDAVEGSTKWVHPLEWTPRRGISVSGDGLIIPAGDEGYLLALRDNGDSVESVWERKDLTQRGTPAQTAGHTGYTVAAIGEGLD